MNRFFSSSLLALTFLSAAASGQPGEYKRTQHPSFSPDGKLIVFSATISKGSDDLSKGLSVMNADGTQVRVVTKNIPGVFDELASISRDGKRIVFSRRKPGSTGDIFAVNIDGSGLTQITNTPEKELRPEFNHDDSGVVFVRNFSNNIGDRYGSLHIVDIGTKKERQILGKEYQVAHAIAAPRGLFFAAIAKIDSTGKPLDVKGAGHTITLISPTGELSPDSPIRLPQENLAISRIQFAIKGKEFVMYVESGGWFSSAYLITPKGTEKTEDVDYSLSPDGTKLVKWEGGSSVYVKDLRAERGIVVGTK